MTTILESQIESVEPVREFVTIEVSPEMRQLLALLSENAAAIHGNEKRHDALLYHGSPHSVEIAQVSGTLGSLRGCRVTILDMIGRESEKNAGNANSIDTSSCDQYIPFGGHCVTCGVPRFRHRPDRLPA